MPEIVLVELDRALAAADKGFRLWKKSSAQERAAVLNGAARLLRVYRLTRDPDKAADYDASLTDERTAYVANKARSMALYICIYVQLAAALAAILIFKQTLVGQVLCALTCLQTLVYTGCFWYYNRKY